MQNAMPTSGVSLTAPVAQMGRRVLEENAWKPPEFVFLQAARPDTIL